MGAIIPRFYTAAYDKIKNKTNRVDLPDPNKIISGIVAIASPDYIDIKAEIPGFEIAKKGLKFLSNNFIAKSFVGDVVDKALSLSISTVMPTINIQKYFSIVNNLHKSMRHFLFDVLGTKLLTVNDFIGYPQITPAEMYLIMEDILCEESTKTVLQFLKSQLDDF